MLFFGANVLEKTPKGRKLFLTELEKNILGEMKIDAISVEIFQVKGAKNVNKIGVLNLIFVLQY